MLLGEVPTLPIGLCAGGDCSPVVLRVAAAARPRHLRRSSAAAG
jgi:hypothetical protein